MLSLISSLAGALEGVTDIVDNISTWLRQKERDQLVRKAETADDKQAILERHSRARRARAASKYDRVRGDLNQDPANRDGR